MSLQPNKKKHLEGMRFLGVTRTTQPMAIISHLKSPAAPDSPDSLFWSIFNHGKGSSGSMQPGGSWVDDIS